MSMLEGAPWLLAHKSMLKTNEPQKISLYGKDYVIWKDKNNNVQALPNICPHMGAMLSEGWCEAQEDGTSKVVCPFHALEFNSKGCTVLPGQNKETKSLLKPLDLIIKGEFIWSYGNYEHKIPIPNILDKIAQEYDFIGYKANTSVETDLLSMLLIMHDYNHLNGTHRDFFDITEVKFDQFIDNGYHSEAFFHNLTAPKTIWEKLKKPKQFLLPDVIESHVENYFPSLVIAHSTSIFGKAAQCNIFVPESENITLIYVLLFGKFSNRFFKPLKNTFLDIVNFFVDQDIDTLNKIYPDAPQQFKLNNEMGMDWVKSHFANWKK